MERKILTVGVFLLLSVFAFAQSAASLDNQILTVNSDDLTELTDENWSFFMDEENKIYYIDFETINVNLNDIIVKNATGEVLTKEDVWDLPVNTIYELDFSEYKPGDYEVELRTFTSVVKKKVSVK